MFIILPVVAFIFLFLLFNQTESWRSSVLSAALIWGVLVTGITEVLSLFRLITLNSVLTIWVIITIIIFFLYIRTIKKQNLVAGLNANTNINEPIVHPKKPIYLFILLFGVIFVVGAVGVIALIAPTNNWDSMAYHMPRVVHWIQNRSVEHYPTNYLAQLYLSPWAEFTILNFQILSGGDRFANLVQWFSMVGSAIGVSLISKELGANLLGQILSSVIAVTIPMGILQASGTKNDYAVCFWLVCLAYYLLKSLKSSISIFDCLRVGMSVGLALFTKGTAYTYALPFLLWFFTGVIKQWRWKFWKPILLLATVVIMINIGHYLRNLDLFGTPIFNPPEYRINSTSFLLFVSNIIKNMSLHMAIPLDIVNNDFIEIGIIKLHNFLGVNINDPRITSAPEMGFTIKSLSIFEDTAGNPLHFYLILISICLFLSRKEIKNQQPIIFKYFIAVLSSFLLFCLLIKWQPWQSRLHITIFVLFAPFIAVVISKIANKKICIYLAIILLQTSLAWVFYNDSRPMLGENNIFVTSRIEQYFAVKKYLKDDYVEAINFVKNQGCSQIGLLMPPERWEYPLWVLFQKDNNQVTRIEHLNVKNISSRKLNQYPYNNNRPCAIICVGYLLDRKIVNKNDNYVKKWSGTNSREAVDVFVLESPKKSNPK
jgi:4-amino-4-deoxy-L-arabinose transferase-like glycosyltransferase